jgi:hypothetical protein
LSTQGQLLAGATALNAELLEVQNMLKSATEMTTPLASMARIIGSDAMKQIQLADEIARVSIENHKKQLIKVASDTLTQDAQRFLVNSKEVIQSPSNATMIGKLNDAINSSLKSNKALLQAAITVDDQVAELEGELLARLETMKLFIRVRHCEFPL